MPVAGWNSRQLLHCPLHAKESLVHFLSRPPPLQVLEKPRKVCAYRCHGSGMLMHSGMRRTQSHVAH